MRCRQGLLVICLWESAFYLQDDSLPEVDWSAPHTSGLWMQESGPCGRHERSSRVSGHPERLRNSSRKPLMSREVCADGNPSLPGEYTTEEAADSIRAPFRHPSR